MQNFSEEEIKAYQELAQVLRKWEGHGTLAPLDALHDIILDKGMSWLLCPLAERKKRFKAMQYPLLQAELYHRPQHEARAAAERERALEQHEDGYTIPDWTLEELREKFGKLELTQGERVACADISAGAPRRKYCFSRVRKKIRERNGIV